MPILATKLYIPPPRPQVVLRSRLIERLNEGLHGKLTLISAPAGFGKTTLVSEWISRRGAGTGEGRGAVTAPLHVAWLSLDEGDNDLTRFLAYLAAALQTIEADVGTGVLGALESHQPPPTEAVLTSLINEIAAIPAPIVLVLDDYHLIKAQPIYDALSFLLQHLPPQMHLVIATRSDPPLPLARLRARDQMVELRTADLRFTESEVAQFMNDVMGLRLDAGSVAMLEERTEGWIAGLQMAALSMRDRKDVRGFIEGFSGTNRYILDYLLEEVLVSQSPEIRRFLLCTSILERLTAPLCDAVLANDDGSKKEGEDQLARSESLLIGPSASILEYLEKVNLFLLPLDDERIWYRYHHLFADLLRAQLQQSLGTQGVAQLHVRAADWHIQNDSILEAIHHASTALDDERVERFIKKHYMELVSHGEQAWLRSWIGKLSKEQVYSRPWLCIYEAYSHSWFGELDEADRLLEEAEKRIRSEAADPDAQSMLGLLAYVKSRVTAMRGDVHRAIEFCLDAREYVPPGNLALQLDTRITLGYEYFLNGDYANASPVLQEMIRSGTTAGAVINTVAASCLVARMYAVQGLLNRSYDTYQSAVQSIPEASGEHRGARALLKVGIADVLCERNDLDAALVHLEQGLTLLPWWDKADDWVLAYITLARIHLAQANMREAMEAVEKANQFIQTRGTFSEARRAVEIGQVKLWLAQGDLRAASRWATSQEERSGSNDQFGFENELARIAQARVLIAQNRSKEAIGLLSQLEETARSAGRMGRVIEILLLKASALRKIDDPEHAILALTECLTLAEPKGYVRVFLDEGRPMQMLLAQWLAHADAGSLLDYAPLREYAIRLLSHFAAEPLVAAVQEKVSSTGDPSTSSEQALIESLSQRELEVLHLIALGRTNKEIARQLFVAPGTVKAHTASIYRKLDVANRTEAVARARQLGLLP